jgi:hypothetical protein
MIEASPFAPQVLEAERPKASARDRAGGMATDLAMNLGIQKLIVAMIIAG